MYYFSVVDNPDQWVAGRLAQQVVVDSFGLLAVTEAVDIYSQQKAVGNLVQQVVVGAAGRLDH